MKTKRSSLRNSVVENNNEKTAVYSQNGSITDIMATDDGKFQYSKDGGQSFEEVSTQVDATLSTTSENPVQNKVITNKFNDIYNANTHTLTVENAQIDGNITDGTNTVTVADIATKVKFITLTSTTSTNLTDEQKGILLEDENNYIVAGGRVFRYSNNLSTADNVKFYTFVGNGATTEDKIIQTCTFFSGTTPALLSFNSELNVGNINSLKVETSLIENIYQNLKTLIDNGKTILFIDLTPSSAIQFSPPYLSATFNSSLSPTFKKANTTYFSINSPFRLYFSNMTTNSIYFNARYNDHSFYIEFNSSHGNVNFPRLISDNCLKVNYSETNANNTIKFYSYDIEEISDSNISNASIYYI